ncbi:hypothetical protein [Wenxinia saemankumensis]|uniref:Uncharacterized protein n=1 Tax=Wenxinia saemankumensis TaxID=1447782 RepID=A0A1M6GQC0_9RHOB|nr:hypothetical protein [Wenxinia saemankumensis]SHJ12139.1 hypothetical protein SAMN05444417_2857 [Wenxinia saemankumensis]
MTPRRLALALALLIALPAAAAAQKDTGAGAPAPTGTPAPPAAGAGGTGPVFGDDSGDFANDGECDDRRFTGPGVATAGLSLSNTGRDATDCRQLFEAGRIRLFDVATAQCTGVEFGDDSGDYANDDECDDLRFEGLGMAHALGAGLVRRDASDCRRYCDLGMIGLRD